MTHVCRCRSPVIKCDWIRGCHCTTCGGVEDVMGELSDLQREVAGEEYTRTAPDSPSDWVTDQAYHAGRVKRYHTWAVHHVQTVGEHCWQVALVYEQIFGWPSQEVERYIRHHDTSELVVGDPPFPVKASNPKLKEGYAELELGAMRKLGVAAAGGLPALEKIRIKVCDLLEMMRFGMVEREMGNLLAVPVIVRTELAATQLASELPDHEQLLIREWIQTQWQRHEMIVGRCGSENYIYENRDRILK